METSNNRSFVISFRLNPQEVGKLDKVKDNRTRADWCRSISLQELNLQVPEPVKPARVKARQLPTYDKQQLSKILGQLGKIGSNVNQINPQNSFLANFRFKIGSNFSQGVLHELHIRHTKTKASKIISDWMQRCRYQ